MPRSNQVGAELHGADELARGSLALASKIGTTSNREFIRVAQRRASMISARMPHRTGKMAASVRGTGSRTGLARVGAYKSKARYMGWVEFGGGWGRDYIKGGRYIYPIGLGAKGELSAAALRTAIKEIRSYRWPKVKL